MAQEPLRLGVVGAHPERGWAKHAHLPALAHVPRFRIAAVSAPTDARAQAAAKAFGAAHAFGDSLELVRSPDIDVVVVTVRVPDHRQIVMAAIAAGRDIFCEWPLGRTLEEAEEMSAAATRAGIRNMVGLQALGSPVVRQVAKAVQLGKLGTIMTTRMIAPSGGWGSTTPPAWAYLNEKKNGATLITVPGGHTLAPMEAILGPFKTVQAQTATHYPKVRLLRSDETVDRDCADHLSVLGVHQSGCVSTIEIAGNRPASADFVFEITGSKGDLKITGTDGGGFQTADLKVETSVPIERAETSVAPSLQGVPANVAELYTLFSRAIDGEATPAADFARAVEVHRLLATIEHAAETGQRQTL